MSVSATPLFPMEKRAPRASPFQVGAKYHTSGPGPQLLAKCLRTIQFGTVSGDWSPLHRVATLQSDACLAENAELIFSFRASINHGLAVAAATLASSSLLSIESRYPSNAILPFSV